MSKSEYKRMNVLHDRPMFEGIEPEYRCKSCGEPCTVVEETFDYAGTHCTYGRAGTHHTGHYVSNCCLDEYEEESEVS